MLRESILQSAELFGARPYFLSEDFSLVDCTIAPLLWRLPVYGVDLGPDSEAIDAYMERVFARRSFQEGLTELEQEMRCRCTASKRQLQKIGVSYLSRTEISN